MHASAPGQVRKVIAECEKLPGFAAVIFKEVMRTRVLTIGAAVAFFFLMSLVPLLMVASALLSALPIPHLFDQLMGVMALLVPPDSMVFVTTLVTSIRTAHPVGILSIAILSYLWSTTGSFSSLIEALNIAYDVEVERSWLRDRLQALLLALLCGGLLLVSISASLAGPHFIHFLSYVVPIPALFAAIWPPLRVIVILTTFVANIMLLYQLGPNRKVGLRATWPGATFAVGAWALGSLGLDVYVDHFANFNATYGSLGAIIVLMFWLYLTSVSVLIGAEINAELQKRRIQPASVQRKPRHERRVPQPPKQAPPQHQASDVA